MIRRIANAASFWEGISFLLSLLAGIVCLAFVVFSWVMHFWGVGQYFSSVALALTSLAVCLAAIARVPVALVLVFGSAVVLGTAFAVGAGQLVMP